MALKGAKVTVSGTGNKAADAAGTDRVGGSHVLLIMEGTGPVYFGGTQAESVANALATQGRWDKTILAAITIQLEVGEECWLATASGTCVVQVIQSGE